MYESKIQFGVFNSEGLDNIAIALDFFVPCRLRVREGGRILRPLLPLLAGFRPRTATTMIAHER